MIDATQFKTVGLRILARMIQSGETFTATAIDRDRVIVGRIAVPASEWQPISHPVYGRGIATRNSVSFTALRDGRSPIGYRIQTPLGALDVNPCAGLSVDHFFRGQTITMLTFMFNELDPRGPELAKDAA
jgi:hypothetical protein